MPSKMYNLIFLFLLSNIQYIASEDKIDLYDVNIQQVEGTNHLEISFRVNGSIEILNGPLKFYTDWEASCPQLTTTTTPLTTTTTMTTITANSTVKNTTPDSSSATYGIIVGAVLIILLLAVIIVILFKKKKRNGKQKRGETVKIDANPVYGNYDNGPIYNVVTDGNDYYASSNNDYDHMGD